MQDVLDSSQVTVQSSRAIALQETTNWTKLAVIEGVNLVIESSLAQAVFTEVVQKMGVAQPNPSALISLAPSD